MPALAAIQYSRESFDTRAAEIVGRRMAGETFLKAWIAYSGADPVTGWADNDAARTAFLDHTDELGAARTACATIGDLTPLRAAGALWLADPALPKYAWRRRATDPQDAWSLIGITHTMSTHGALDRVADLLIAPVQRWDALICTSHAIKRMVTTVLEAQADYLRQRVGATACTGPMLPVIPLGVPCDALAPDPAARAHWRAELGIADDEVAVLQFGRIAIHCKAHPLPLYHALRDAAARVGRRPHLIFAGKFINPAQERMFNELAAHFDGAIRTHFVDGHREDVGDLRSAADIGTLLSDNIQESFGLAPVELMAAGLPVVASDWDGLRDTIEHGRTGFLVDTIMPPPGSGGIIALRHALEIVPNDSYVGGAAQSTAVDHAQAVDAFAALLVDPELRRTMGEAGRLRARERFDWPVIIAAYRALLGELTLLRRADAKGERAPSSPDSNPWPARPDPFRAFAAHATRQLGPDTRLVRVPGSPDRLEDAPAGITMVRLTPSMIPAAEEVQAILSHLAQAPLTIAELAAAFPEIDPRKIVNLAGLFLKQGFATRS